MAKPNGSQNVEQLRTRIDRGETKDKTPGGDPAAAPLGTDDEAAGTRPTREQVAAATHAELAHAPAQQSNRAFTVVIVLVAILTVLAVVAALIMSSP